MEVKVTLDLSERFAGCLDAAVEALKELKTIKVDNSKDHGQKLVGPRTGTFVSDYGTSQSISLADLKKAGPLTIPKNILEEIRTGRLAHERSEFERSILQATEPAKEPEPTRKRASKKAAKEVEHEVAEGAAPAEPVAESEEQPAEGVKKDIDQVDLRPYLKALWETGHNDSNDTLFAEYEATGLKDLDPARYEEFYQDLQELAKTLDIEEVVKKYVVQSN